VGLLERSSEDKNLEIAIFGLEPVTAPGGGSRCGDVWNVGERGPVGAKNLESGTLWPCDPCNPLKSHKTAKAFFGKAWRKQPEIWKSLEKGVEAALIPPPPPLPQRCRPAAAVRTAGRPCQERKARQTHDVVRWFVPRNSARHDHRDGDAISHAAILV
jgi:hypothetical protein